MSFHKTCSEGKSVFCVNEIICFADRDARTETVLEQESMARGVLPISDNARSADSGFWDGGGPEFEDDIERSDFEWDEESFIEEEIPASPRC